MRVVEVALGAVVVTGCGVGPPAEEAPATARRAANGASGVGAAAPVAAVAGGFSELLLEGLRGRRPRLGVGERNPFRFESAGDARGRAPGDAVFAAAMPDVEVATAVASAGAVAEPAAGEGADGAVRFIGLVDVRGRPGPVAVVAADGDVYHGRVNDVIEGRYRILDIGAESVDVAEVAGGDRMTLRLREARAGEEE